MDGIESDTTFIQELCAWARLAPSAVAARAGIAATTVLRPFKGTATTRISQPTIDKLRQAFPDFPKWKADARREASDQPIIRSVDAGETVDIQKLDLSLSMGPGTIIDDYVEAEIVKFDLALVRAITRTPTERLRVVTGHGHSMEPTLHGNDMILIDTNDRQLARQDAIYWIDHFGAAGLKRLRTIGRGRVLIVSDNPSIENQEVDADDLRIDGRAIWFARDL